MNFIYIILGLILLVLGGNLLLKSSVGLSLKFNISKIIIGMTVVSIATSAPELIVSIKSAMAGFPDIALGNVIGSNIANIGLILGIVMIINAMKVDESFFKTDWPAMMISSVLLFLKRAWHFALGGSCIHRRRKNPAFSARGGALRALRNGNGCATATGNKIQRSA